MFHSRKMNMFVGPQLSGNIVAPKTKSEYSGFHTNTWLGFSFVNGLAISGKGTIDGRGSAWWQQPCVGNPLPVSKYVLVFFFLSIVLTN